MEKKSSIRIKLMEDLEITKDEVTELIKVYAQNNEGKMNLNQIGG